MIWCFFENEVFQSERGGHPREYTSILENRPQDEPLSVNICREALVYGCGSLLLHYGHCLFPKKKRPLCREERNARFNAGCYLT